MSLAGIRALPSLEDAKRVSGSSAHVTFTMLLRLLANPTDNLRAFLCACHVAPGQVYKMHLVEGRAASGPAVDSARQNLASTFVNAFVNAGFGTDKLMTGAPCCTFCELCCVPSAPSSVYRMASPLLVKSGPSDQEETLETLMQAAQRRTQARCTESLRTRPG